MKCRIYIIIFLFLQPCADAFAQKRIDSLEQALKQATDTSRIRTLLLLGSEYNNVNPNKSMEIYSQALELSLALSDSDGMKGAYKGLGVASFLKGEFNKGLVYANKAVAIKAEKRNNNTDADAYTIMGMCSFKLGRIEPALGWYHKALQIYEANNDVQRTSMIQNNIGSLYYEQARYAEALRYYLKAKPLKEKIGDKRGLASIHMNIATIFLAELKLDSALMYYNLALPYYEQRNDSIGIAQVSSGIGTVYTKQKKYENAMQCKLRSLYIARRVGDRTLEGHSLTDVGTIYSYQGKTGPALAYLDSGLAIAKETGSLFHMVQAYGGMANHYERINDAKNGLYYTRLAAVIQDSMRNEKNATIISEIQSRYDAEQKQEQIYLLAKNNELKSIQLKNNTTWLLTLICGLLLLAMIGVVLLGRNAAKKRTNLVLKQKNELLSQQEEEITDSIKYSLTIQQGMLPSEAYISASLHEYFVLNRPKDIVSGDFYFFERQGDYLVFSAVDCTGHGVPGALLSFLGMDILKEAVHKRGLTDPSQILGYLDFEVNQRLRQSTDALSVSDGMDLALCSLNLVTNEVQYSGAFNPMYIISGGALEEIKPDKYAIGSNKEGKKEKYTVHTRQLKKGDCLYIFSDGYADQFGGPAGKKFKYRPLQNLLIDIHQKPMAEQKEILDHTHRQWKGDIFQVDDILIIGVRI
jgi:serine phosphatase RsbU (regulator of sigma subunit)